MTATFGELGRLLDRSGDLGRELNAIQRGLTGYPVELLANVVRSSNGLYTMAGMLLAILSGDETLAKRMSKIQPRFADCLPPLVAPTVRGRDARRPSASSRDRSHGTVCCTEPTSAPAPISYVPTRVPAREPEPGNPASMRLPARSP